MLLYSRIQPFAALLAVAALASCSQQTSNEVPQTAIAHVTAYVDPYIGSGFHGHVFVGASVPFGGIQLGPTQLSEGWDWCSGYHYSDSVIIGFSHTHLSGTGIGDLGDILVMPVTGNVKLARGKAENPEASYGSVFSHSGESVKPGYYSVQLKRYGIKAELTATERVGFHRYTFPSDTSSRIIIDLQPGIGWDVSTETFLEQVNDSTLSGYRYSKGWAVDQRIYFTAIFSAPIRSFSVYEDEAPAPLPVKPGKKTKAVIRFAENPVNVMLKVGISPVSTANALANIQAELPDWNFDATVKAADAAWEKELGKVKFETADTTRRRIFYTALYHTMVAPSIFNDHNGDYRGTDKQVYHDTTFTNLTTFSLWDTYRGAHPLFTLLQQQRVNDMVKTMLKIYEQQGKLPVWHLVGNETNTMPGNSAFPVIADAALKGFDGFDAALALKAMKASVMRDDRGLGYVHKLGYIPATSETETVAKGLEYSIDDWSAAQLAKRLGQKEEQAFFEARAKNYRHYFDKTTRFMRGRISETEWRTPFSPFAAKHMKDDFAEGNAWQYTWLVPHDVAGLMELMGGPKPFTDKLDSLFVAEGDMGEEASDDITGLIGQYAHGNEPSHHITYLYAYAGQPWKTAEKVRFILDSLYTAAPAGLCGNEDVGQMSAWYVLSSMGFYQVNPANGVYVLGSPSADRVTLQVGNGKTFTLIAKNNSTQNIYVQKATLNGKDYTRTYIRYADIVAGGELVLEMGNKPSTFGVKEEDWAKD